MLSIHYFFCSSFIAKQIVDGQCADLSFLARQTAKSEKGEMHVEVRITGKISKINQNKGIHWFTMTRVFTHKEDVKFQSIAIAYKHFFAKRLKSGIVVGTRVNLSVHEGNLTAWRVGRGRIFNPERLKEF